MLNIKLSAGKYIHMLEALKPEPFWKAKTEIL